MTVPMVPLAVTAALGTGAVLYYLFGRRGESWKLPEMEWLNTDTVPGETAEQYQARVFGGEAMSDPLPGETAAQYEARVFGEAQLSPEDAAWVEVLNEVEAGGDVPLPGDAEFNGPVKPTAYRLAELAAEDLRKKGKTRYDRALLKDFQAAAGITADGIYGPFTMRALVAYGILNPPQPFVRGVKALGPVKEASPSQRGSMDPMELALEVGQNLSASTSANYARDLMRYFQKQVGLPDSGLYDGATRGALIAFGVDPQLLPLPFYGSKDTVPYFGEVAQSSPEYAEYEG